MSLEMIHDRETIHNVARARRLLDLHGEFVKTSRSLTYFIKLDRSTIKRDECVTGTYLQVIKHDVCLLFRNIIIIIRRRKCLSS